MYNECNKTEQAVAVTRELAERLRQYGKEHNLKDIHLARKCGMTRSTMFTLLRDRRSNVSLGVLIQVYEGTGINALEIYKDLFEDK